MGIVFRALCIWLLFMMYTIFLALRLDEKVLWNWFIVFIPLYLLDGVIFVYVIINAVQRRRSFRSSCGFSFVCYAGSSVTFLIFKILLCLKLENVVKYGSYVPAIPGWTTIALLCVNFMYYIAKTLRR